MTRELARELVAVWKEEAPELERKLAEMDAAIEALRALVDNDTTDTERRAA